MKSLSALIVIALALAPFVVALWCFMREEVEQAERRERQQHRHREDLAREKETRARDRVENRASLPAQWADQVEREVEAGRKIARLRWGRTKTSQRYTP
jgi:uncharacterized protein HemX